jgi:prepilin-type N-terminal cleavage/methylation domain-containing protein
MNHSSSFFMRTSLYSAAGFTLLELMIVMSMLGVIMLSVTTLYIANIKNSEDESRRAQLTESLTLATDNLTDDVKNASAIEASYSSYTSGSQTVVLDLPAVDSSHNIIYSGTSFVLDRVVYAYASGALTRSVFPGSGSTRSAVTRKTVLSKITALNFTYPNSPPAGSSQMSYSITVADSFKDRTATFTGYNTVDLRNF